MNDPIGKAILDYFITGKAEVILVDNNYTEGEEMDPALFFRTFSAVPISKVEADSGSTSVPLIV